MIAHLFNYMIQYTVKHMKQDNILQNLPVTSSVILLVATIDGVVIIIISHSITLPSSLVLNSGML